MANNRVAYGLAKERGIDTSGMSPKEVWDALNEKSISVNDKARPYIDKNVDELKKSLSRPINNVNRDITVKKKDKFDFYGLMVYAPATIYQTNDGIQFAFKENNKTDRQKVTYRQAVNCFYRVIAPIRKFSQKQICFVDYKNPEEEFWFQQYNVRGENFSNGDDKQITIFENNGFSDDDLTDIFAHEIGHRIDIIKGNGKEKLSLSENYRRAILLDFKELGVNAPTRYGQINQEEDFAESIMLFNTRKSWMEKCFPNRTKLIREILEVK